MEASLIDGLINFHIFRNMGNWQKPLEDTQQSANDIFIFNCKLRQSVPIAFRFLIYPRLMT